MYHTIADLETGVALLDEQHKQLFNLSEQAHTLLKDENTLYKFDDLKIILKGLREYSFEHFREEEAYMDAFSYSQADTHKKLHLGFVEKLDEMYAEVERISLGNQDSILLELWDYLAKWLENHILTVDKEMVREGKASGK